MKPDLQEAAIALAKEHGLTDVLGFDADLCEWKSNHQPELSGGDRYQLIVLSQLLRTATQVGARLKASPNQVNQDCSTTP
jgi:hypothetical protein